MSELQDPQYELLVVAGEHDRRRATAHRWRMRRRVRRHRERLMR